MKKIINQKYDETYYQETLNNGLEVLIWSKPNFNNSVFCFATPFGAYNLRQEKNGEAVMYNAGIAHFLEHKMFENEDNSDVMEEFTKLGCNCNAFTSYTETVYYFSTAKPEIKKPLELLLNFVQSFSVSKESVEKEKGIIVQEFKMYQQMPESRLYTTLFKALFHNFPLTFDISGDEKSINAISKEELELAHRLNYHPSRMLLSIVTNKPAEEIIEIIKNNQNEKQFSNDANIVDVYEAEPVEVASKSLTVDMHLVQPKIAIGYKFEPITKNKKEALRISILLKIWLLSNFSKLNPLYQKWRDENLINDSFAYECDYSEKCGLIILACDKISEDFVECMHSYLMDSLDKPIDEKLLVQLKKRFVGQNIKEFNNNEDLAINIIRNHWLELDPFEEIEIIESIKLEDFEILREVVNLTSYSVVNIK